MFREIAASNLESIHSDFDYNCNMLEDVILNDKSILNSIEKSKYYSYIKEDSKFDSNENAAVVYYLGQLFREISFSNYPVNKFLFISSIDSVCSKKANYLNSEECFKRELDLSDDDVIMIKYRLGMHNGVTAMPLPPSSVDISTGVPENKMAVIVSPKTGTLSSLSVYDSVFLNRHFNLSSLPQGTVLHISDLSDNLIYSNSTETAEGTVKYESVIYQCGLKIQLFVPTSFSYPATDAVKKSCLQIFGFLYLIGFVLCLLFSKISIKPLKELIRQSGSMPYDGDEIKQIDTIIKKNVTNAESLKQKLLNNILLKAFSNQILSDDEENFLLSNIPLLQNSYQIAILSFEESTSFSLPSNGLFYLIGVSDTKYGIILEASEQATELLDESLLYHDKNSCQIHCGVSIPSNDYKEFFKLVCQAQAAITDNKLCCFYSPEESKEVNTLWFSMEHLYNSVISGNMENAEQFFDEILCNSEINKKAEALHGIYYVLISAGQTIGAESGLYDWQYNSALLIDNNALLLKDILHRLVVQSLENNTKPDEIEATVIPFIKNNFADCNMCASYVASVFEISERKLQKIIRKNCKDMNFNDYLTFLRMGNAAILLKTTEKTSKEIALLCGYQAESTFFRVFKKYYNCTPKEYKGI